MYKKILQTMCAALLVGGVGAASADITLFGHIDTSLDAIDIDGGYDDINMNCTTCSIGFKGSEDLGNGLKAIFKLDFQYDTSVRNDGDGSGSDGDNNNSGLLDRDQWLGLAGGFGKLRVGTISTGYKSHGAMIDPLYRTALQGRARGLQSHYHSGAGEELEGRATNTARYDSPDFGGVKLVAHYTVDSDEAAPAANPDENNPFGLGASYSNGGILVFADYMDNNQDGLTEKDAWKLGGKYTTGMFSVMGQYEDYSNDASDDETVWHVAGTAGPIFGISAYLGFGKGEDDTTNDDYTAWTFAVMHNMSKRTMVYSGFSQVDCDAPSTLSACSEVGSSGGEDDKFSLGLKHKF
jgi:predicted porin